MADTSLRSALRLHTQAVHTRLDNIVGQFESLDDYRAFVIRSYRFRAAVEPTVRGRPEWSVQDLAGPLRADLKDLRQADLPSAPILELPLGFASALGALYVLEGSGVGARILFARAQQLGLSEHFGARHLAAQTDDPGRWKRFVALLGTAELDHSAALHAAGAVFQLALSIHSEPVFARA
ncbi:MULTISPECIES: biliverdin-producing heme oxygenase [unclassified Devosia]|uniref:biliverdin-producing heme oxygenase n=1 Tax=unclassified Devosia TaxID=196773 RepID=UPI000FDA7381|nr:MULTISPECIES: biliverdin-producing heme oxygenase [unclassified Devosia]